MENIKRKIVRDPIIWKFCAYGFLKNLKLFEPYLMIYLLGIGQNLFSIGILYSVREAVTYIFEVPSGILADNYGRKKELMTCFVFYIISFLLLFAGSGFPMLVAAMIFFGLGEAFRSGTHKAMIYSYLENRGWFDEKAFVYGRTRSFSLLGSSISAFTSILFVLALPGLRWIFMICTIPYLLDFFLIWSYPDFLDEKRENQFSVRSFLSITRDTVLSVTKKPELRTILLSSALFDGLFRSIKDYIQPILVFLMVSSLGSGFQGGDSGTTTKVCLGILYGVFYVFSSMASRNVYRLRKISPPSMLMNYSFAAMGILFLVLSFSIRGNLPLLVMGLYFILYVMKDARRPIFMDLCGNWMVKRERATVMSLDSQIRAVVTIAAAPIAGWLSDKFSIGSMFLVMGFAVLLMERLVHISRDAPSDA